MVKPRSRLMKGALYGVQFKFRSMVSKVLSTTLIGIDAFPIQVEAIVTSGKWNLKIVGLPDGALREARERVRCAIFNSGFRLPQGEIVVSLAPAELPKTGSGFDLAIALAVLAGDGQLDPKTLKGRIFLGELSLDGHLKQVKGVLAAGLYARKREGLKMVVPLENEGDGALLHEVPLEVAGSLTEVVAALKGHVFLKRAVPRTIAADVIDQHTFADVQGQFAGKRALEISAAGNHNLLFVGPPGSGKTMLAERLPALLPPLEREDALEVSRVEEIVFGTQRKSLLRPFRSPHHTCSTAGLVGGGSPPKPGEITLAHRGVLFLDELPEFRRDALESLRQPLELKKLTISRSTTRITFPADFTLIAAMNPCPCGKRGLERESCRCTPPQIRAYLSRVSGPVLDRIDLQLWVRPVSARELITKPVEDPTATMQERVMNAIKRRKNRGQKQSNGQISQKDILTYCRATDGAVRILGDAVDKFKLSARAYSRALKVARSVADLEDSESVKEAHVAEALSYRLSFEKLIE